MEIEVLNALAGLGAGGILAAIIFFIYRSDRKASECQLREDRKFMEDRLTLMLEQDQDTREENTKALSELTTLLNRMNGKH
jgi:hypothetical protein